MQPPRLVWFRGSDLRLHDNEVLLRACTSSLTSAWPEDRTAEEGFKGHVVPVFCLDPRLFQTTHSFKLPKTGELRAQFLLECIAGLRQRLQAKGSNLVVRMGCPEEVVPVIAAAAGAKEVFAFKDVCSEEVAIEKSLGKALQEGGVKLEVLWGASLYHIDDLPFAVDKIPDVFKTFRQGLERNSRVRPPVPEPPWLPPLPAPLLEALGGLGNIPSLGDLPLGGMQPRDQDPRGAFRAQGGETAGLARVEGYFWKRNKLKDYKWTRNQMLGEDYSSKLAAYLAHGCVSPRWIHAEVRRYETSVRKNVSTYWLIFELIWRDYFRYQALKHGARFFYLTGTRKQKVKPKEPRVWGTDIQRFEAWRDGCTGFPLIDANMRELKLSGYMSNRGRQNVCSFLVHDLGLDWRLGAEWFESALIDYDVCQNYGNWLMGAGVGADPRMDRYFSIPNQSQKYDPKGEYVALWLPELSSIAGPRRTFPHLLSAAEQADCGIKIGPGGVYPLPIVPLKHGKFEPRAKVVGSYRRKAPSQLPGQKTLPFKKAVKELKGKPETAVAEDKSTSTGVTPKSKQQRRQTKLQLVDTVQPLEGPGVSGSSNSELKVKRGGDASVVVQKAKVSEVTTGPVTRAGAKRSARSTSTTKTVSAKKARQAKLTELVSM